MPGGDLSTMLLRLGFVAEPMASFYVLEVLLGMYLARARVRLRVRGTLGATPNPYP